MSEEPNQNQPNEPEKMERPSGLAILGLFLAFVPSLLMLSLQQSNRYGASGLGTACVISIICCFTSAFLLIRHNTWWAILIGLVFILINLAISFLFGCVAVLSPH